MGSFLMGGLLAFVLPKFIGVKSTSHIHRRPVGGLVTAACRTKGWQADGHKGKDNVPDWLRHNIFTFRYFIDDEGLYRREDGSLIRLEEKSPELIESIKKKEGPHSDWKKGLEELGLYMEAKRKFLDDFEGVGSLIQFDIKYIDKDPLIFPQD